MRAGGFSGSSSRETEEGRRKKVGEERGQGKSLQGLRGTEV